MKPRRESPVFGQAIWFMAQPSRAARSMARRMRGCAKTGALRHAKLTIPPWFPNDLGTFSLRIATLRRNHAECTGACLDDFEDVIFLRRKIVDGMAPGQAALYSASMEVTVLIDDHQKLAAVQQRFLHFIALYDWKDWSRSRSCCKVSVSCHAKLGRGVRRFACAKANAPADVASSPTGVLTLEFLD
jgi:hypothetical protein